MRWNWASPIYRGDGIGLSPIFYKFPRTTNQCDQILNLKSNISYQTGRKSINFLSIYVKIMDEICIYNLDVILHF